MLVAWLAAWLGGSLWNRAHAQADFDRQRNEKSFLYHAHIATAFFWCFMVGWPTTFVELAGGGVIACALLRLPTTWRVYKEFLTQPLVIVASAFLLWHALSLLWTQDRAQGILQASQARWAWTFFALWPVMTERRKLLAALAVGLLCGNASQIAHAIGTHWHIDALRWDRAIDRNSGWWKPVVGASMLSGALGLHLPAALRGVGPARWLGITGSAITLVGVFATGSRGAWIAASALLLIAAVLSVAVAKRRRRAIVALASAAVVFGIVIAIAWPRIGPAIERRVELARADIHAALDRGDYASDTGARIAMAMWAVQAFKAHPIIGVGAGGYQAWVRTQQLADQTQDQVQDQTQDQVQGQLPRQVPSDRPPRDPVHTHAHNSILHIAATTGIVGVVLALAALAITLRNAAALALLGGGGYSAGPFYALLGLVLVSPFDPVHINSQTAAFLTTLLALSPSWMPRTTKPSRTPAS